jgi:hypothetical protein
MNVKKIGWKSYEELAATIYSKLDSNAAVMHDDHIYGYDTEIERQIDVSIRNKVAGHEILVIVQARDRKRAPNVNDVGEFADVVRDVRAHKGVMVCRKPPGKNAARLAAKRNIDMCSAFDVNDRSWSEDIVIPVIVSLIEGELEPSFTFATGTFGKGLGLPNNTDYYFVSTDGGRTQMTLLNFMNNHIAGLGLIEAGKREYFVKRVDLHLLVNGDQWIPLPHLLITAVTKVRKLFRHCKPTEYLALKNHTTGELMIADVRLELSRFGDTSEWKDGTDVDPYEHVTETLPVVSLQLSKMLPAGTMQFRALPMSEIEYEPS